MKLLNTFANKKKLKILKADHIYLYDYNLVILWYSGFNKSSIEKYDV